MPLISTLMFSTTALASGTGDVAGAIEDILIIGNMDNLNGRHQLFCLHV